MDKFSLDKTIAFIVFMARNVSTRHLGIRRLMHLMYFSDMHHVCHYGVPITYDTYKKLKDAIIPQNAFFFITRDVKKHSLGKKILFFSTIARGIITRIYSKVPFDEKFSSYFTKEELNTMKIIAAKFGNFSKSRLEKYILKSKAFISISTKTILPYRNFGLEYQSKYTPEELDLLLSNSN